MIDRWLFSLAVLFCMEAKLHTMVVALFLWFSWYFPFRFVSFAKLRRNAISLYTIYYCSPSLVYFHSESELCYFFMSLNIFSRLDFFFFLVKLMVSCFDLLWNVKIKRQNIKIKTQELGSNFKISAKSKFWSSCFSMDVFCLFRFKKFTSSLNFHFI